MKVISYSLFGDAAKYCVGALRNIELARELLPGWHCWFYVDGGSVPRDVGDELVARGGTVRLVDWTPEVPNRISWRLQVWMDPKVEAALIRDTDCRFCAREADAIADWLASGKKFHVMRDHAAHQLIPGGLWGARFVPELRQLWPRLRQYWQAQFRSGNCIAKRPSLDELFSCSVVWPLAEKHGVLVHDGIKPSRPHARPFPSPIVGGHFVGEVYDEDNKPRFEDRGSRGGSTW